MPDKSKKNTKKITSINLLRHQDRSFFEKFFNWAFTIGRLIVIITETVALSAFAYRIVLDRQIIDLRDEIKGKQAVVALSESDEKKFRNLQSRLTLAKILIPQSPEIAELITDVVSKANGKISFRSLEVNTNTIQMDGSAASVSALNEFVKLLGENPRVASVSLNSIENKTASSTIDVNITLTIKTNIESV